MLEIKDPNKGERLQVADNDFENRMEWNDAKSSCNELGNGWRLPTKSELELMRTELHKKGKGNFKSASYWSGTETDRSYAWSFDFHSGFDYSYGNKNNAYYVRAVRAI